jgi:hypothetical protein
MTLHAPVGVCAGRSVGALEVSAGAVVGHKDVDVIGGDDS